MSTGRSDPPTRRRSCSFKGSHHRRARVTSHWTRLLGKSPSSSTAPSAAHKASDAAQLIGGLGSGRSVAG